MVLYQQDHQVSIQTSVTIHQVVHAARELSEGLSTDRLCNYYADQLELAARTIRKRLEETRNPANRKDHS